MTQSKITRSARGEFCTLRLGNCSAPDTVVFAHFGRQRGTGKKCSDMHGAYACYNCHVIEEDKSDPRCTYQDRLRSMEETQLILVDKGLVVIA